jgi:hypothetical protein
MIRFFVFWISLQRYGTFSFVLISFADKMVLALVIAVSVSLASHPVCCELIGELCGFSIILC